MARILFLFLLLAVVSCQSGKELPGLLLDQDVIPVGSTVEFWIYHDSDGVADDEDGWQKSNIHIRNLPRPMTGAEARRWATGVGQRDAGLEWTHYYVLVTHPGPDGRQYRSAITPHTPAARLQSPR